MSTSSIPTSGSQTTNSSRGMSGVEDTSIAGGVSRDLDSTSAGVEPAASRARQTLEAARSKVAHGVQGGRDRVSHQVQEHPVRTMLYVFGAGALAGLLLRRRRHRDV